MNDLSSNPARPVRPFRVTNRMVVAIAAPMTLAYLTTPLLGIVDTAVVGQFGDPAQLGGLAAGSVVLSLVFVTFNFLRSGTTGLVAQAIGAEDPAEEQAVFWRAVAIALVAGIGLLLLAPLLILGAVWFMNAAADVTDAMVLYVTIRLYATPMALINYAILGYVLGRGEGTLGLLLQVLLNGTNIVLSILLGLHLEWGVAGVAWGTVGGEAVAMLIGGGLILRRFAVLERPSRRLLLDRQAFRRMIGVNRDIMIRSFALLVAFSFFNRQGAQLGTTALAANAVLANFFLIGGFLLDGLATAAEQLGGRAVGANHRSAFVQATRLTLLWGFAIAGGATLVFLVFGDQLIALLTTSAEVRTEAGRYLVLAALTAFTGVLAFQMDGIYIGATWSRDMRNMMLLSLAAYLAALIPLTQLFGNFGLWAALHLLLIVRGLSLTAILPHRIRQTFAPVAVNGSR